MTFLHHARNRRPQRQVEPAVTRRIDGVDGGLCHVEFASSLDETFFRHRLGLEQPRQSLDLASQPRRVGLEPGERIVLRGGREHDERLAFRHPVSRRRRREIRLRLGQTAHGSRDLGDTARGRNDEAGHLDRDRDLPHGGPLHREIDRPLLFLQERDTPGVGRFVVRNRRFVGIDLDRADRDAVLELGSGGQRGHLVDSRFRRLRSRRIDSRTRGGVGRDRIVRPVTRPEFQRQGSLRDRAEIGHPGEMDCPGTVFRTRHHGRILEKELALVGPERHGDAFMLMNFLRGHRLWAGPTADRDRQDDQSEGQRDDQPGVAEVTDSAVSWCNHRIRVPPMARRRS